MTQISTELDYRAVVGPRSIEHDFTIAATPQWALGIMTAARADL